MALWSLDPAACRAAISLRWTYLIASLVQFHSTSFDFIRLHSTSFDFIRTLSSHAPPHWRSFGIQTDASPFGDDIFSNERLAFRVPDNLFNSTISSTWSGGQLDDHREPESIKRCSSPTLNTRLENARSVRCLCTQIVTHNSFSNCKSFQIFRA